MTSPFSAQPKQWKKPCSALTLNDGERSSWKGHSPVSRLPTRRSCEVLADDLGDGRALSYERDVLVADPSGHVRSATCPVLISPAATPPDQRV